MNPDYAALSASDGDGEPVRATVQSPGRSIGSTTIPVQATTNWPAGTFIATTGTLLSSGKLDPTTVQVFYGTASGTDITITAFAAGYTDKGNESGDVVVIKPSTEWANVVAEGILGTTQFPANFTNFVEPSTGIWSAGAGLVGSGTSGFVWFDGARSAMAAVTNHTFAATKDTYIDYNPTSATWTYLPETNGAAEPAVSTGSVRIAKVITGASAISSVTQTAYNNPVLPQTLGGNKVWQYLNSATYTGGTVTSSGATPTLITNLSVPVVIPDWATAVRITVDTESLYPQTGSAECNLSIYEGATSGALTTQVGGTQANSASSVTAYNGLGHAVALIKNPTAGATFFSAAISASASNAQVPTSSTTPAIIQVEIC